MRRVLFSLLAVVALAAVGPATALAKHHGKKHHRSRVHSHVQRFGSNTAPPTSTSSADNAGTVMSFDSTKGILIIKLTDGTPVSGVVNDRTELRCESAQSNTTGVTSDFRRDGGPGGGDNQGGDNQGVNNQQGADNEQGAENEQGDDNQQGSGNAQTCTPAAGDVVHEAELSVSGAGSIWNKVDLIH